MTNFKNRLLTLQSAHLDPNPLTCATDGSIAVEDGREGCGKAAAILQKWKGRLGDKISESMLPYPFEVMTHPP